MSLPCPERWHLGRFLGQFLLRPVTQTLPSLVTTNQTLLVVRMWDQLSEAQVTSSTVWHLGCDTGVDLVTNVSPLSCLIARTGGPLAHVGRAPHGIQSAARDKLGLSRAPGGPSLPLHPGPGAEFVLLPAWPRAERGPSLTAQTRASTCYSASLCAGTSPGPSVAG